MRQPTTIQKRSSSTLTDVWHAYGLLFIEGASVPRAVQASQVQPVGDGWSPTARDTNGDRRSTFESSMRRRLADTGKATPAFNARERSTPESGRAYVKLPPTRHRRGDGPADRRLKDLVAVRAGSPH